MSRRLRICVVLASSGYGGLERHFIDLCDGLSRRHTVIAIGSEEFAGFFRNGGRLVFEPFDVSRSRHNPLAVLALRRILKRWKPDVVHAHANKAATLVKRAAAGISCARVATIHNLKTASRTFSGFNCVIAVSREIADRVTGSLAHLVYNGIEPATVNGHDPNEPPVVPGSRPYVAAVGRLVPAKGFDLLIDAWRDVPARLVIAGEGPQRPLLEQLIAKYGLSDKIHLLGHCRDVPALLAGAMLTVVSSRHEGFGYVCVESLHAGTPLISTRVAIAEEILPSRWLVPPGDPAALRHAVLAALADPASHQRDMEPVFAFVREQFTLRRMVQNTTTVYRDALSAVGCRRSLLGQMALGFRLSALGMKIWPTAESRQPTAIERTHAR